MGYGGTVTLVVVTRRWGSPGSAGCTRWLWRDCYPGACLTPLGVTRFGRWCGSGLREVGERVERDCYSGGGHTP